MSNTLPGFSYDPRTKRACFIVYVPGAKGRSRRKRTIQAASRAEALHLWATFRDEVSGGQRTPGATRTLAQFFETTFDLIAARIAPSTAASYRSLAVCHILPALGSTPLDRITTALVHDLAASMRRSGLTPSSVNATLRTLKVLLHQAVERGEIETYPLKRRVVMEQVSPLTLELSDAERERFLAAFDDDSAFRAHLGRTRHRGNVVSSPHFGGVPRSFGGGIRPDSEAAGELFRRFRELKPLFVIALETGLRQGDLLRLRWAAVDTGAGMLRVTVEKTRRVAVIPISTACLEALHELRSRSVLSDSVFVDDSGRAIGLGRILRAFRTAKAIAGIRRRFRFHDIRHTFACRLASSGVPIQLIARALAHTSIRTCERYARPSEEALRMVRDALDRDAVRPNGVRTIGVKTTIPGR